MFPTDHVYKLQTLTSEVCWEAADVSTTVRTPFRFFEGWVDTSVLYPSEPGVGNEMFSLHKTRRGSLSSHWATFSTLRSAQ